MGLFKIFGGGRKGGGRRGSGYKTYKTKAGTTIKQGSGGKVFTHKSKTKSGGSKSTTYSYDSR